MSTNNDRMRILKMIETGEIDPDEGAKMLEDLSNGERSISRFRPSVSQKPPTNWDCRRFRRRAKSRQPRPAGLAHPCALRLKRLPAANDLVETRVAAVGVEGG